jgi:hypothetical protein
MELKEGEPIAAEELDTLAAASGIALAELWPLIERGVTAGYIAVDEDDAIALSPRGQAWWKKRYADR